MAFFFSWHVPALFCSYPIVFVDLNNRFLLKFSGPITERCSGGILYVQKLIKLFTAIIVIKSTQKIHLIPVSTLSTWEYRVPGETELKHKFFKN